MFAEGRSFSGFERNPVWLNKGDASFITYSALSGADSPLDSRAVLTVDFDEDGDLDIFVHNLQRERHLLYRNDIQAKDQTSIAVRLKATKGQWEAIGATVIVSSAERRIAQVLSRGAGFLSCQAPELVFGLGSAKSGRVEVLWPGGMREDFGEVERGARVLLVEGSGETLALGRKAPSLPAALPLGMHLRIGARLPVLELFDHKGQPARFDAQALAGGKPLLVNLWASTCAPCIAELDDLAQMQSAGPYEVVLLSLDPTTAREAATKLVAQRAPTLRCFYLRENGAGLEQIVDLVRLPIPTTLELDADGRLQRLFRGKLP